VLLIVVPSGVLAFMFTTRVKPALTPASKINAHAASSSIQSSSALRNSAMLTGNASVRRYEP
jgi:hypothetical protein